MAEHYYCTMLYCTVLYYTILYYTMAYCTATEKDYIRHSHHKAENLSRCHCYLIPSENASNLTSKNLLSWLLSKLRKRIYNLLKLLTCFSFFYPQKCLIKLPDCSCHTKAQFKRKLTYNITFNIHPVLSNHEDKCLLIHYVVPIYICIYLN